MSVEFIERFLEQVAKGDDGEHEAKRDQCLANSQTENHHCACDQFHERNDYAHCPKGPDRKKGVRERQEVFARVIEWSKLEYLHHTRHKENQPEYKPRKQNGPRSVDIRLGLARIALRHNLELGRKVEEAPIDRHHTVPQTVA